jgi:hypothetical protein
MFHSPPLDGIYVAVLFVCQKCFIFYPCLSSMKISQGAGSVVGQPGTFEYAPQGLRFKTHRVQTASWGNWTEGLPFELTEVHL